MRTLFLCLFLLAGMTVCAEPRDTTTHSTPILVAKRANKKRLFALAVTYTVRYQTPEGTKRVTGRLNSSGGGLLTVTRKKKLLATIAPDSILALRRIHPLRDILLTGSGIALLATGAALLDHGNGLGDAVVGIVAAATGSGALLLAGSGALHDLLTRTRQNKG